MFLFKNKFLGLFVIIFGLIISSLFFLQSKKIIFAGENLGGWAWSAYKDSGLYSGWGWISESCNNIYYDDYQDYCGLSIKPILDINFDGNDIDFDTNSVKDNSESNLYGRLYNFIKSDLRNGGKNKTTGATERDSNFNNSLYFDGVDNYIIVPRINLGNQLTIAWWSKAESKTESQGLFNIGNGGIFNTGGSYDQLTWDLGSAQVDIANAFIWDNDWHYYSFTRNNTLVRFYRDGNFIGEDVFSNNGNTGKFNTIGRVDDILNYWQGELDEIRIFEQVLSEEQIEHNMHHNANYLLNIEENTGEISGWSWSNNIGWICFGTTCDNLEEYSTPPGGGSAQAVLHWEPNQASDIYPHMITGWAKAISFDNSNIPEEIDTGWIQLQSPEIIPNQYNDYLDCISCIVRDEEAGLRGYWKFNESSGDILTDYSGADNHGDLMNFVGDGSDHGFGTYWNEDGYLGNCLDFDGENDYVDVGSIPLSTISSITWWSRADPKDEEGNNGIFLLGNGNVNQGISTSGANNNNFLWKIEDPVQLEINNAFLWDDEWHYYAVVRNNANVKFYRDGIYVNEDNFDSYNNPAINKTQELKSLGFSGGNYFKGQMDYTRFYEGILLSEDDIEFSFTHPEKRSCSACLKQNIEPDPVANNICYQCEQCGFDIEDKDGDLDEGEIICEQCASCRKYGLAFDSNAANIKGYAWSGFTEDEFGNNRGLGWIKFSPNYGAGLYRSYLSTRYGNIYSQSNIGSDYTVAPPAGYFNATYMIQANGHVTNWISSQMIDPITGEIIQNSPWLISMDTGQPMNYEYPKLENDYGNVLGNLDYQGLLDGSYGEVDESLPGESGMTDPNVCLGGRVYYFNGDATLNDVGVTENAYIFENCANGSGTIIIDGDLTIEGNIRYENEAISGESIKLASVAWIIKGDLKISSEVENLAGTFIVLGQDGVDCGSDFKGPTEHCGTIYTCYEEVNCDNKLIVSGQFLAKNFSFQRTWRSLQSELREAAELIIYDGRNVINPPPGLGDVLKTIPRWDQIAPY